MQWDRAHLEGRFAVRGILEAARAWVPQMLEEGADLIVALAHSGISASSYDEMMENAALHLAAVEGIDAVVAGHHHLVFPSERYADEGIDAAPAR